MSNIFVIRKLNRNLWADWDSSMRTSVIVCPKTPGHRREGHIITKRHITFPSKPLDDFMWVLGGGSEVYVSKKVIDIFNKGKFTGFTHEKVLITYRGKFEKHKTPPEYSLLRNQGWGGQALLESGIKLIESCPYCGLLKYNSCINNNYLFDKKQWDGSDGFFIWPLPNFFIITKPVRDSLIEENVTGVEFINIEEVKFGEYGFMPGRLRDCLPDELAHKYGDPLGIY